MEIKISPCNVEDSECRTLGLVLTESSDQIMRVSLFLQGRNNYTAFNTQRGNIGGTL